MICGTFAFVARVAHTIGIEADLGIGAAVAVASIFDAFFGHTVLAFVAGGRADILANIIGAIL